VPRSAISRLWGRPVGLYVHIPFCSAICPYCDFVKIRDRNDLKPAFLEALEKELLFYRDSFGRIALETLYLGGGTPSTLDIPSLADIFEQIRGCFDLANLQELTIEMNPEHVTPEYADGLAQLGVNRVSLGVQSMYTEELRFLGRAHTPEQVKQAFHHLQSAGIDNISADIIYGLPGRQVSDLNKTITGLLGCKPTHISVYHLTIEEKTPFAIKKIKAADDDIGGLAYDYLIQTLEQAGYAQYEVSAFARPNRESRHNLGYWQWRPYIGVGPGSHSFFMDTRYEQKKSLHAYFENPYPKIVEVPDYKQYLSEKMSEFVIVQFRQKCGLDARLFQNIFNEKFEDVFYESLNKMINQGHIDYIDGFYRLSSQAWMLTDSVIAEILTTLLTTR